MTKKLEDLFNLPTDGATLEESAAIFAENEAAF